MNLIDFVPPSQSARQWVFVLPFDLHVRVARDVPVEDPRAFVPRVTNVGLFTGVWLALSLRL